MKRSRWFVLALAAMGVLALATSGFASKAATPSKFKTSLNNREEVPKPQGAPRLAKGNFRGELNGNVLSFNLDFTHLSGAATAAHIHTGARGKSGPVLVPLCGPCKSPLKGKVKVTAAQIKVLQDRGSKLYVNVHTAKNPAGEIRGQIR